jgi:hypothetical protein
METGPQQQQKSLRDTDVAKFCAEKNVLQHCELTGENNI